MRMSLTIIHQAWHFIMLSGRGRITDDGRQQRRNKTNTIWRFRLLVFDSLFLCFYAFSPPTPPPTTTHTLHSRPPSPHLSVVVLYTQGAESKQWREVRNHSRSLCQHNSISPARLHDSPLSVYTPPRHPLCSLKVNAVCQSLANWSTRWTLTVSTVLALTDWLIRGAATHNFKDFALHQTPLRLLEMGPN